MILFAPVHLRADPSLCVSKRSFDKQSCVYHTEGKLFFYPLPKRARNTPKRGELFSFFEFFTAEFNHFLVTKKMFFVTKKWLKFAVKISKNEKSSLLFGVFFFRLGRGLKKKILENKNIFLQLKLNDSLGYQAKSEVWCRNQSNKIRIKKQQTHTKKDKILTHNKNNKMIKEISQRETLA